MQPPLFELKQKTFTFFTAAITLFSRVSFSSKYLKLCGAELLLNLACILEAA